jgi:hypothetical protein
MGSSAEEAKIDRKSLKTSGFAEENGVLFLLGPILISLRGA